MITLFEVIIHAVLYKSLVTSVKSSTFFTVRTTEQVYGILFFLFPFCILVCWRGKVVEKYNRLTIHEIKSNVHIKERQTMQGSRKIVIINLKCPLSTTKGGQKCWLGMILTIILILDYSVNYFLNNQCCTSIQQATGEANVMICLLKKYWLCSPDQRDKS